MSGGEAKGAIDAISYRMAFAGGWIDQPFVSRHMAPIVPRPEGYNPLGVKHTSRGA